MTTTLTPPSQPKTAPLPHAAALSNPAAADECRRLAALHRLGVLDTAPEAVFDAITTAAAQAFGVPIALISLVDAERQWFKSNIGLPGVGQTPRQLAFCDHTIREHGLMEVPDAQLDARFASNALVTGEPHIRFYAGAPIEMPGGERIGSVCVIDRAPRQLSPAQRELLANLARVASACFADRLRQVSLTEQLAGSEARYRAIVEDQAELISVAKPDGTLAFVNEAYARHFGRTVADMTDSNLFTFVHEHDRPGVRAHLDMLLAQGRVEPGVSRSVSPKGQTRWVSWNNRLLHDEQGKVVAVQSVGRDITEQKLAEIALAKNERRQRRLYEETPAMLHSIDAEGRLLVVSDLWLSTLGYERQDVLGREFQDFLTPESQQRARDEVLPEFFRTGRCENVVFQFVRKDGGVLDVLLSATLEHSEAGTPMRSLAVLEDITERKRLAAELGRTHAHLDAIVDNVPATLGYWERDGTTRFANREFQASMGIPLAQIIGQPLREIYESVDPIGYAAMAPHIHEVLQGRRQEFELAMLTMSGLRQLRVTLVPDQSEAGRVTGFYGLGYDITGRKALELRLGDSELRYRSLFDHLNSGFALHEVVVDTAGKPVDYKFLAMNAAFAAMTGLDPARTLGRRATELLPSAQASSHDWIGQLASVALTGQPLHTEQHAEALGRWFEVVAYRPVPGQFAVLMQDITQRKNAETELALGEQRLRLLVDAVRDHAVCLLDAEGYIKTWSAGAERIKGYTATEIIGQHYRRFFDPADARDGEPERQLARAASTGQLNAEGWRHRKDGSRFWAAISLTPVRDAQGLPQGYVKVTRDLTERQKEQDLIRRVAELSPSAMLLIDEAGHIVFANAQTETMFGYQRAELIGQGHGLLMPEPLQQDPGGLRQFFMATAESRPAGESRDFRARRKDGTAFDVEIGLSTFDTEDGRAALAAIVDVTERRKQQQHLEHALEEKETLLKEVYHRVKNNLQVVQSLLGLQRRSMPEGAARTAIDESVQRVRAIALVHEKLYQSGSLASVALPEYALDLLKQIGEAAGASQRGIVLRGEIAAVQTGLDSAIPFGLLIAELVGNALKHGFPQMAPGEIRVVLEPHEQGALLTVSDNGVGLKESFDLAAPRTMGLQLAANLARQLGGELKASSSQGAAFSAVLTRL